MYPTPTHASSARPAIVIALLAAMSAAVFAVLPNVLASAAPAQDARSADTGNKVKQTAVGIWDDTVVPPVPSRKVKKSVTLGLDFSSETPGRLYGIQYYAAGANRAATTGRVWNARGKQVAKVRFPKSSADGWKTAWFSSPVKIRAGKTYTASYRAPKGRYAMERKALGRNKDLVANGLTARRGTFVRGPGRPTKTWRGAHYFIDVAFVPKGAAGDPTPTPNPTPIPTPLPTPSAFPDASNTGPTGTLTDTSGSLRITTPGTVIENRKHTGTLQVAAAGVTIRNVHVVGNIAVESGASVTILDSLVDNGTNFEAGAISGESNITVRRTEVIGGGHSFSCQSSCDIQDSWFHGQANPSGGGDVHGDGILFNQANNMIVKHNTLACDMPADGGGACSAGLAMYGDWDSIQNVTVENNLFKSSPAGYCMYGGNVAGKPYGASNVDVINNVFEKGSSGKCAAFGPYSARATDSASSWTGNKYIDGAAVN